MDRARLGDHVSNLLPGGVHGGTPGKLAVLDPDYVGWTGESRTQAAKSDGLGWDRC